MTIPYSTYEEALKIAKDLKDDTLNSIIEHIASYADPEFYDRPKDRDRLYDLVVKYINNHNRRAEVYLGDPCPSFLVIVLLHLRLGTERMKKLVTCRGNIFFDLGPQLININENSNIFTRYFISIGLAKELYLTYSKSARTYPVHYICRYKVTFGLIRDVPKRILSTALLLQDKGGNTPFHMAYNSGPMYNLRTFENTTKETLANTDGSPKKVFEYMLFNHQYAYYKALSITNNKGRTPLHEMCSKASSRKILFFLVDDYRTHPLYSKKDKRGNTPYDLCLKNKDFAELDKIGSIAILAVLKSLKDAY